MSETWTIKRLLEWTTDYLGKQGRNSARLEAEILLASALACQRIDLYTNFENEPTEEKRTLFRDYVKRRGANEPVAYIVGAREFYSLTFKVNRCVLIPRPETELLVVEALDWLKQNAKNCPQPRICDVGTGSGAIAVAIAKHFPNGQITAVDQSPEALALAAENAQKHNVGNRIVFCESNLLDAIDDTLDLIVSNPPYVSQAEYENLDAELKDYEPKLALLGGEKGTELIEKLIPQTQQRLRQDGAIFLEVSPMIADRVAELFDPQNWKNVYIIKDLANLKRIVRAEKN